MLDAISSAESSEGVRKSVTARLASISELNAIVSQDGVDMIGHCFDERLEERDGRKGGGPPVEAGESELLGGATHRHEQVGLALLDANLADVYVKVADLVVLEPATALPSGARETRDAVTLEAAVQCGAGERRYRRLKSAEDVIER